MTLFEEIGQVGATIGRELGGAARRAEHGVDHAASTVAAVFGVGSSAAPPPAGYDPVSITEHDNWNAWNHRRIYSMLQGIDPELIRDQADRWSAVARELGEIFDSLERELASTIRDGWAGVAADAALQAPASLAAWGRSLAESAERTGDSMRHAATGAERAQHAVGPPQEMNWHAALSGVLDHLIDPDRDRDRDGAAGDADASRNYEAAQAGDDQARRAVSQVFSPSYVAADGSVPAFALPADSAGAASSAAPASAVAVPLAGPAPLVAAPSTAARDVAPMRAPVAAVPDLPSGSASAAQSAWSPPAPSRAAEPVYQAYTDQSGADRPLSIAASAAAAMPVSGGVDPSWAAESWSSGAAANSGFGGGSVSSGYPSEGYAAAEYSPGGNAGGGSISGALNGRTVNGGVPSGGPSIGGALAGGSPTGGVPGAGAPDGVSSGGGVPLGGRPGGVPGSGVPGAGVPGAGIPGGGVPGDGRVPGEAVPGGRAPLPSPQPTPIGGAGSAGGAGAASAAAGGSGVLAGIGLGGGRRPGGKRRKAYGAGLFADAVTGEPEPSAGLTDPPSPDLTGETDPAAAPRAEPKPAGTGTGGVPETDAERTGPIRLPGPALSFGPPGTAPVAPSVIGAQADEAGRR